MSLLELAAAVQCGRWYDLRLARIWAERVHAQDGSVSTSGSFWRQVELQESWIRILTEADEAFLRGSGPVYPGR
jgi:hypothetical protein